MSESKRMETTGENAESQLLLGALGSRLASLQSAAVFFCGDGAIAVALARARTTLRVSGFDLHERSVRAARARADAAGLGDRAVFARLDARIAAYGGYGLVVVRFPVSEIADGEGALRAAVRAGPLCAVLERFALETRVARQASELGLLHCATRRDAASGAVLMLFEAR